MEPNDPQHDDKFRPVQPFAEPPDSFKQRPFQEPGVRGELAETDRPIMATMVEDEPQPAAARGPSPPARRWVVLPVALFSLTCVSTFLAGAMSWYPIHYVERWVADGLSMMPVRQAIVANWREGLIYMGCVLAILLTHEMGHFLATVRYGIRASYPYFLPLPISPLGTLGAVIRMDGMQANRKEIFDIGLAGPLAGLVVAIPITWIGIQQMNATGPEHGPFSVYPPLLLQWMMYLSSTGDYTWGTPISQGHLNPYLMAGWVGLLITGLNMLPVSQLDGGHVVYTLFRRNARWIARGFVVLAIGYTIATGAPWWLMIILVMFIGVDHPPTRDDSVPLGWFRTTIGLASLAIPILCFAPALMDLF